MHHDQRRLLPVTCLAAAAGLAIMLAAGVASSPPPVKTPAYAFNPHWSPAGCRECHGSGTPTRADFTPMKIEKLCTGCHDAQRAPKPVHPSYRPITGDQLRRPAGWPLLGNRVGCITCHEVLAGCRPNIHRPAYNSVFLRGYDGRDLGQFCTNCHVRAAQAGLRSPACCQERRLLQPAYTTVRPFCPSAREKGYFGKGLLGLPRCGHGRQRHGYHSDSVKFSPAKLGQVFLDVRLHGFDLHGDTFAWALRQQINGAIAPDEELTGDLKSLILEIPGYS